MAGLACQPAKCQPVKCRTQISFQTSDCPLYRMVFIYRYLRPPMQMLFSDESVVFGKTDFWAQKFTHLWQN
jgi:hypothetical protein